MHKSSKLNNNIYTYFDELYQFLEQEVFQEKLADIFFTLESCNNSYGSFVTNAFRLENVDKNIHQITMNPNTFGMRTELEIQATFLHEMVHLWDELFGKAGKGGYHGKMWAMKMHLVGLTPISLDNIGKETGFKCTHEIKEDGIFMQKIVNFKPSVSFDFTTSTQPLVQVRPIQPRRSRKTYKCPSCPNANTVKLFEDELDSFLLKCICGKELTND